MRACRALRLAVRAQHSAEGWEEFLLPEIERQQEQGKDVVFWADAAFPKLEIYEALEGQHSAPALERSV